MFACLQIEVGSCNLLLGAVIQLMNITLTAQPNGIFPRVSDVARYFYGILTILTSYHIYFNALLLRTHVWPMLLKNYINAK